MRHLMAAARGSHAIFVQTRTVPQPLTHLPLLAAPSLLALSCDGGAVMPAAKYWQSTAKNPL
jgi:hypothetical protein